MFPELRLKENRLISGTVWRKTHDAMARKEITASSLLLFMYYWSIVQKDTLFQPIKNILLSTYR